MKIQFISDGILLCFFHAVQRAQEGDRDIEAYTYDTSLPPPSECSLCFAEKKAIWAQS